MLSLVLWDLFLALAWRNVFRQFRDRVGSFSVNIICPHVNVFPTHMDIFNVLFRFQVNYLALLLHGGIFLLQVFSR